MFAGSAFPFPSEVPSRGIIRYGMHVLIWCDSLFNCLETRSRRARAFHRVVTSTASRRWPPEIPSELSRVCTLHRTSHTASTSHAAEVLANRSQHEAIECCPLGNIWPRVLDICAVQHASMLLLESGQRSPLLHAYRSQREAADCKIWCVHARTPCNVI